MIIYFNNKLHKYTDEFGNKYISATTIISNYEHKFSDKETKIARACSRIGRNISHPKYLKYKNKSTKQILSEWKTIRDNACNIGNIKHNYLDTSIKQSNGFFDVFNSRYKLNNNSDTKLFTIEDIKNGIDIGDLDIEYFITTGIKDKYPKIFNIIKLFINDDWKVFSEVGVFSKEYLISGQIDIIFIKNKSFVILDWKTNKNIIKNESGYWDKDINGHTTNYITTNKYFKIPLNNLPESIGNKYILQLSMYDYLVELFGFKYVANILCHIKHDFYTYEDEEVINDNTLLGKNKVNILPIKYLKNDIINMINHYTLQRSNGQFNLI